MGDSSPLKGVSEPCRSILAPAAHGDVGRTMSNDFRIIGTGDWISTGRNGCGEEGVLPRSSCGARLTFKPSKCDSSEDTGFIGAASVPLSFCSAMVVGHSSSRRGVAASSKRLAGTTEHLVSIPTRHAGTSLFVGLVFFRTMEDIYTDSVTVDKGIRLLVAAVRSK